MSASNGSTISNNNPDSKGKQNGDTHSGSDVVLPAEDLKTWLKTEPVKLRTEAPGGFGYRPITVMTFLEETTNKCPDRDALAVKRGGQWVKWSYKQYLEEVRIVAKGFIKLGLEPMNAVGILGFNSPEWFLSELGCIYAGGLVVGVYTTNTPEACRYVLDDSSANIVVVENDQQLQKILKVRDQLPHLKAIIQWDGQLKEKYDGCYTWAELMEMGRQEEDETLEDRIKGQAPNKCCAVVYTSGTTGNPKGALISHDNLTWTALTGTSEERLKFAVGHACSFLPLSHIAAQMADLYNSVAVGCTVYFAQPDALKGSLVDTLKEVRPTAFLAVPRVWEKIMEKMREVGKNNSGLKKKIADWAKDVGYRGGLAKMHGGSMPWGWSIANALVFKKVKAALGLDRCTLTMNGAAPMSEEVYNYFLSLDIPLMEVYGLTETTGPHSLASIWKFRPHSAPDMSGVSTKFCDVGEDGAGEVCMYGRNVFMGYLNQEEKTKEALDEDGWFHSGDIGKKDKDGFLQITGRIKEIIITAGGENVAPVPIEDKVKEELDVVSNCMLIGDKRKFLSMLITLKTEVNLETSEPLDQLSKPALDWCQSVGCSAKTVTEIMETKDDKVLQAIQKGIDRANDRAISRAQKMQKWSILPKDFSIPGGELGPTLKLKRSVVCNLHKDTIDAFYTDA